MNELPPVDIHDPHQNAFVQDWLSAYLTRYLGVDPQGDRAIETTIECVQETYDATCDAA